MRSGVYTLWTGKIKILAKSLPSSILCTHVFPISRWYLIRAFHLQPQNICKDRFVCSAYQAGSFESGRSRVEKPTKGVLEPVHFSILTHDVALNATGSDLRFSESVLHLTRPYVIFCWPIVVTVHIYFSHDASQCGWCRRKSLRRIARASFISRSCLPLEISLFFSPNRVLLISQ